MSDKDEPVRIMFARLPSQGVVYGLTAQSLVALSVAASIAILSVLTNGAVALLSTLPITAPIAALGVLQAHGEPLITHIFREAGGLMRQAMGGTKYRKRPEKKNVQPVSTLDIPGKEGRLHLYETDSGVVVIWDARLGTATISCVVATPGLGLPQADAQSTVTEGEREALVYEWARVLGSFTQKPHVVRVTQLEHTRPGSAAAEREQFDLQSAAGVDSPVAQSYRQALQLAEQSVVLHTTRLAITFTLTGEVKALMKGAGSRKAGMLAVAELEMSTVEDALFQAGFQRVAWMTAREWGTWGRSLIDPAAQPSIDARVGTAFEGVDPASAMPMLIEEHRTVVETDSAWHRTFWIQEWPRYETFPGFMSALVFAKQQTGVPVRHTIALVGSPTPVGKAMKTVDEDKRTWITNERLRSKTGKPSSQADDADWVAIQQHEADLVAGQGELRLSAFLTVTATSREDLELECASMLNSCARAGLEPRSMPWQQAEALMNVVYPSGLGMK